MRDGSPAGRDEDVLFGSSAGQSPSLSDIVKMVHPQPAGPTRQAFYGYMLGRSYDANTLPKLVMQFEQFKARENSRRAGSSVHAAVGSAARQEGLGEHREECFVATRRVNLDGRFVSGVPHSSSKFAIRFVTSFTSLAANLRRND